MAVGSGMQAADDFGSNRHSLHKVRNDEPALPSRHSDFCFADGNIALIAGSQYFLVHSGLVARHSEPLSAMIKDAGGQARRIEGYPLVLCEDSAEDMAYFLGALYDGM
jgi:hypothetical protein